MSNFLKLEANETTCSLCYKFQIFWFVFFIVFTIDMFLIEFMVKINNKERIIPEYD